jgi:hypothetical protein
MGRGVLYFIKKIIGKKMNQDNSATLEIVLSEITRCDDMIEVLRNRFSKLSGTGTKPEKTNLILSISEIETKRASLRVIYNRIVWGGSL